MSKVLVLSQHDGQIDRRIVAEMNTLVASGRNVTLVSILTSIPQACLDERVQVIIPTTHGTDSQIWHPLKHVLKRVVHTFPPRVGDMAKAAWQRLHSRPDVVVNDSIVQATPHEQYDAIHCHDLDTLPTAVAIRERIAPCAKLIYDSHEFFPFQFPVGDKRQLYWSRLEEAYIREADLVITVNASIARELSRLYTIALPEILYNSYGTHGNVARLDEQAFLQHFSAASGGFRVMFQGGFVREKNLINLVTAFQQLDDSVQLFLLGDGPIAADLRELCRAQHIDNVFFGSWVPQAELLRYISHADLGVIPYSGSTILNNLYCTPNKLFEFIEAEIPICANDLPELRQIVVESGIGDVYPMKDPETMARAIEVCRTRCLQGVFTSSALRAAREKFSWVRQEEKLLKLYKKFGV